MHRPLQHAQHTTGWGGVGQPLRSRCSATSNMAAMAAVTVQARPAATLQRAAPSARALFCQARPAPRSSFSSRLQVAAVAGEHNACAHRLPTNMQGCAAPQLPPRASQALSLATLSPRAPRWWRRLVARPPARRRPPTACRTPPLAAPEAEAAAASKPEPSYSGVGETYAVVDIGGHQLIVEEGRWYTVNRLEVRLVGAGQRSPRFLQLAAFCFGRLAPQESAQLAGSPPVGRHQLIGHQAGVAGQRQHAAPRSCSPGAASHVQQAGSGGSGPCSACL